MPHWTEKLARLRREQVRNLAQLEQLASWPKNSLATAIREKSEPGVGKAIRLAKALHVGVEALFDPSIGYDGVLKTLTIDHLVVSPAPKKKTRKKAKKKGQK